MLAAVERFRTDLLAGEAGHDGDPRLTRHVMNARMREARGGYFLVKDTPMSPNKIDLAVAAVLAYEARCDALVSRKKPGRLVMFS
jgi:phage terminase large subunit-like protein